MAEAAEYAAFHSYENFVTAKFAGIIHFDPKIAGLSYYDFWKKYHVGRDGIPPNNTPVQNPNTSAGEGVLDNPYVTIGVGSFLAGSAVTIGATITGWAALTFGILTLTTSSDTVAEEKARTEKQMLERANKVLDEIVSKLKYAGAGFLFYPLKFDEGGIPVPYGVPMTMDMAAAWILPQGLSGAVSGICGVYTPLEENSRSLAQRLGGAIINDPPHGKGKTGVYFAHYHVGTPPVRAATMTIPFQTPQQTATLKKAQTPHKHYAPATTAFPVLKLRKLLPKWSKTLEIH